MREQDKEFEGEKSEEDTSELEAEFKAHWEKYEAKIQKHVDAATEELKKAVDLAEYKMDLEEEFKNLVEGMREKVRERLASGDLSKTEATDLEDMITDRVSIPAWNNSGCYQDNFSYDYSDGWQPSQVCW